MDSCVRAVVFDFDGVIVESNHIKTQAFEHVFSGFPEHAETMMAFHYENIPISRVEKFARLLTLLGRPDDEKLRQHLAQTFSDFVMQRMLNVAFVPGALELLDFLKGRVPVDLASVTPQEELYKVLSSRNLAHFFSMSYGCPPWKKGEALLDAASRHGIVPGEILLIGDSAGDQRAAAFAGTQFLARDSGLSFDAPHPRICKDLVEAKSLIEQML